MSTNNLNLISISSVDSSKESIINENFFTLDSFILIKVLSVINSIASLSSANGDVHLVSSSPDSDILDYVNHLVIYHANFGYKFISPQENMVLFVVNEGVNYVFENGAWVKISSKEASDQIDDSLQSSEKTYSSNKIESLFTSFDSKKSDSESVLYKTNNLLELSDKSKSRENLEVYSKYDLYTKKETEEYVKSYAPYKNDILYKINNGSDVLDKASFLENIGAYSKAAVDLKISNISSSNQSQFVVGDYKQSTQTKNHGSWLLCQGGAVSRTTYASLYAIIGTSFGAGDGSTTFNLPDFRGRVYGAIGSGSGLTTRALGALAGEESHTLTVSEMPSHNHTNGAYNTGYTVSAGGNYGGFMNASATTSSGGGQAHNNMQPTLFGGNVFIFTGV